MSRCENCGYHWQEEWEDYPSCKYNDPWPAPCEYDDEEEEIEEDDHCWDERFVPSIFELNP